MSTPVFGTTKTTTNKQNKEGKKERTKKREPERVENGAKRVRTPPQGLLRWFSRAGKTYKKWKVVNQIYKIGAVSNRK